MSNERRPHPNAQPLTVFSTSRRRGQELASRFFHVVSEAIEIALVRVPPIRIWRRGGL
jgi:hypothetical protein